MWDLEIINAYIQILTHLSAHSCLILFFLSSFLSRPLHVAARNGLTVVVQELLAKGASVLAVDENGN